MIEANDQVGETRDAQGKPNGLRSISLICDGSLLRKSKEEGEKLEKACF
jgi:hypothetical protein